MKNLTHNNRSWSLINHVLVSFSASASRRHLQFSHFSASSSFVAVTLQRQWCIYVQNQLKRLSNSFSFSSFFTVSWSQVYLNDYLSSLAAIARWGALDCPRVSWVGWERELGRDVPLWGGCGSPGCLWGWSLPWQQEVLPEPRPQCLAGICMWHHSALDELLADLLLTRELLWQRVPCSHSLLSSLGCDLW